LLILGGSLARGKRTVTSALRTMGLARKRHVTSTHRVLYQATWHPCFAAKVLLGLLVCLLPPQAPLEILVGETIERRNGDKLKTKGTFRDGVRSFRNKVIHCYGLRWVVPPKAGLLVRVPWSARLWGLPFNGGNAMVRVGKTYSYLGPRHAGRYTAEWPRNWIRPAK